MNFSRLMVAITVLLCCDAALCQYVEIFYPSDGDSVGLKGFAVAAEIGDIPEYDIVAYDILVEVWDEANEVWATNSNFQFTDDAIVSGRNLKVIVPNVYRFSKWPRLKNFKLLALVGDLSAPDEYYFPAKIGDHVRLEIVIQIWKDGTFYLRSDYANLTITRPGHYLYEKKQCIIFEKTLDCPDCCR